MSEVDWPRDGRAPITSQFDSDPAEPAVADPIVSLVSVNVARPRIIGRLQRGEPVLSGIDKRRVGQETLLLDLLNLEGDRQADLRVHGGRDKAVYAYPSEHVPRWNAEFMPSPSFGPGTFGENLTTSNWLEDMVYIGDVWSWGDALLQVTQPRSPCYKLALITGQDGVLRSMVESGRTGWYLRVLEPGEVPVRGPIHVIERHPSEVTVLDAHRAMYARTNRAARNRIAEVDALAIDWRNGLLDR